ncbi:MAG: TetR family transcriptional regulator [Pseudomonadales bacterium RIFCSPLOWO2_12_59_9]|nr:MAG: TetR family transcriptional regulator [Pseudomonadales bacterium RIFCSPLOWO2_12_59_9]
MVRRTKEDAQKTRSQILEAAEQAFHQRGMSRTTLAEIASIAGVTRGAIYWHFSNKADLVQAMLDSLHEPLDELSKASQNEDEVDPLGFLRLLLIKLFEQLVLDTKIRRIRETLIYKCEFTDAMCDLRQQRQSAYLDINGRIELSLSNAVQRGQLPADLNIPRAVISLHGYIDGIVAQWLLVPDSFALAQEAAALVDAALDMLRLSPALRR